MMLLAGGEIWRKDWDRGMLVAVGRKGRRWDKVVAGNGCGCDGGDGCWYDDCCTTTTRRGWAEETDTGRSCLKGEARALFC